MITAQQHNPMHDEPEWSDSLALEESRSRVDKPPLYRVIILNDDYTPMDFVVEVLMLFFGMSNDQATSVMLHVHTRGRDRKSTRLNSSHVAISYAVFCL